MTATEAVKNLLANLPEKQQVQVLDAADALLDEVHVKLPGDAALQYTALLTAYAVLDVHMRTRAAMPKAQGVQH
jgi:hypothetical protein